AAKRSRRAPMAVKRCQRLSSSQSRRRERASAGIAPVHEPETANGRCAYYIVWQGREPRMRASARGHLWKGFVSGAVGGLVASFAMGQVHSLFQKPESPP